MSQRLGDSVKARRKHNGWSLRRMAKETGISKSKLSKLERLQYDPRLSEYKAICDAFKLRVSIIL